MHIHKTLNAGSRATHGHPHALAILMAVGVLAGGVGLGSQAMDGTGGWQDQLSNGLKISLRAVADGRDTLVDAAPAQLENTAFAAQATTPAVEGNDARRMPLRADLAPRSLQPRH